MRVLKKLAGALLTVWIVITISFAMAHFMPGDPLEHLVGQERYYELLYEAPEELEKIAEKYGLNESLGQQYLDYMKSAVTLDFGIAYSNKKPVLDNVLNRAGWTLVLSIPTFLLGGAAGSPAGHCRRMEARRVDGQAADPCDAVFAYGAHQLHRHPVFGGLRL